MAIPEEFLDRLRACVRISEVAIGRMKLRREGGELVAVDNHSLKINDKKGTWKDFGNDQRGGDIFTFVETFEGVSFLDAVKRVAQRAGLPVPGIDGNGHSQARRDSQRNGSRHEDTGENLREERQQHIPVIVGEWDYVGLDGRPQYQTVRMQWRTAGGDWARDQKTGKISKTFFQRRRTPDVDGRWINSLSVVDPDGEPIPFMRKGPGSDWQRYNEKKYRDWRFTERRTFEHIGNISHTLLHLPEIAAELAEERHEHRTIFIPEGEKKVDLLRSWGLLATCNSGGAQNWHEGMARLLDGAGDIVILEDNDEAGRKRTSKLAPMLLEYGCRVRALSIASIWPSCPPKGDIVDWAETGGGTKDALFLAVEKLPDWTPPPYQSQYGAFSWGAHNAPDRKPYEWTVKDLIPAGHAVLIIGPSGSGKSFETTSLALSVARGVPYNGRRVKKCGVVYLNYEAGQGMANRLQAYQKFNGIPADASIPFAWLTRPPGLYASEENAVALAKEVKEVTSGWVGDRKLGVIVVDTHNAATRGSSEIKTEDITKVLDRYAKVSEETGAAIWIVGHTNSNGQHRGNEVLYNGIETCIVIEKITEGGFKKSTGFEQDAKGRTLRRVTVKKQREGVDGVTWNFVLQSIHLGDDADGDPITSMVSTKPDDSETPAQKYQRKWSQLSTTEKTVLDVLSRACGEYGKAPPLSLQLPRSVANVVTSANYLDIKNAMSEMTDEEARKAWMALQAERWVACETVDGVKYMWRVREDTVSTTPQPAPIVDTVTGQPITEEDMLWGPVSSGSSPTVN